MGKVHELVSKHIVNGASIASISACDHLIVGGVSNWGGWALALCLFKGGGGLSATGEFRILNALVDAGARDGVTSGAFLPLLSLFGPVSCSQSLKNASIFPDWSFLPCMCVHECETSRVCTDGRWAGMVTSRGASATHVAFVKARTVVSNSHGRALSGTPPQQKGQSATPSMQATDTRSVHHDAKFTGIKGLTGTMQTIACLLPATSAYRQLRGVHIA